jgi:hypothetical protein
MSPYVDHCWSVDICSWVHGYYSMLYHDMRHCSCFTQSLFNYTVLSLLLMTNPWKTLCWHPNGGKWQTAQPCSTSINGSMTRQNALFYNCILYPIGSMYGIYANIWGILMVNVSIYTIHGTYGSLSSHHIPVINSHVFFSYSLVIQHSYGESPF